MRAVKTYFALVAALLLARIGVLYWAGVLVLRANGEVAGRLDYVGRLDGLL
ncbi:MAG TPA: hypothetical protein VGG34_04855 [Opitutaceae bacterium]|jgi:hypothetical protein